MKQSGLELDRERRRLEATAQNLGSGEEHGDRDLSEALHQLAETREALQKERQKSAGRR